MLDSSDIARRFAGIAALRGSCSLTEQEMSLLNIAQWQTERMNRVLQSPEQWPSHREAVERERKVFSKIGETLGRVGRCNEGRFTHKIFEQRVVFLPGMVSERGFLHRGET